MRKTTRWFLVLALLAPVCFAQQTGDGLTREGKGAKRAAKDALEGKPAPALKVTSWMNTKDDKPLELKKLVGKVVIIDFWGTW